MLAYAYNNTIEEEITSAHKTEKIPKIPEEVKKKLRIMVEKEWPQKNVRTYAALLIIEMICVTLTLLPCRRTNCCPQSCSA